LAGELGAAAVRGLQGASLSDPLTVLACAKHYVGDGGTSFGTGEHGNKLLDQGDTRVDEATLRRVHLSPYGPSIAECVGSIMPSYNSWNGLKCTGNKYLLTDVLKQELGFDGFLISDYNAVDQVDPDYREAVKQSINAGIDMAMAPDTYKKFYNTLKELVEAGEVPMSRIDDAVRRILRVKAAMGLLDKDRSQLADRDLHESFGAPAHRTVARQAVRESLVLLKNEAPGARSEERDQDIQSSILDSRPLLPLSKQAGRIHVGGHSADDIGNQCGGWTIEWQGASGDVTTGGTTILAAIKSAVADGTDVTYSKDGSGAEGADVGIVVVGETPYAEGNGDDADLALSEEDLAVVRNMKSAGIPVVVILFSGRPMMLGDVLQQADALVAAWLPGTEGDGVADVLFGDYAPTGKLSFTWPRSTDQLPINVGDDSYDPLFPYGYGLTYDRGVEPSKGRSGIRKRDSGRRGNRIRNRRAGSRLSIRSSR
jgi:beta-glucosidase